MAQGRDMQWCPTRQCLAQCLAQLRELLLQASSEGRPGEGTSLLKVARGSGGHAAPELRSARLSTDGPLPDHPLRSAGLEMILVTQRMVPGAQRQ